MVRGNEPLKIPFGIGLGRPDNAVVRVSWTLILAALGCLVYGFDSSGALLLATPLLLSFATALDQLVLNLQTILVNGTKNLSVHALALGPFLFRFHPFRVRFNLHVPREYFFGPIIPDPPAEKPTEADIWAATARARVATTFLYFAAFAAFALGFVAGAPLLLVAVAGTSSLVFAYRAYRQWISARQMAPAATATESRRANAIHAALVLAHNDRQHELSTEVIREMTALHDGSYAEMVGQTMAYYTRVAQGEAFLAALHVRRAVAAADALRRVRTPVLPSTLSVVYHEAAFVAAAYAGDVDFAVRAMAIGSESYFDRTAFHKAMTAIWIRRADKAEAARSLQRAEKELRFWKGKGAPDYHEVHLAELRDVFAGNELRPLAKDGIGADFFAEANRPSFFTCSKDTIPFKFIYYLSTVLLIPTLFFASFVYDVGVDDAGIYGTFLVSAALFFFNQMRFMACIRLSNSVIELSAAGILLRAGPQKRWIPWESVERFGRIGGRLITRPGLIVSREAYRRAGGKRLEPAFIPTTNFGRGWPDCDIDDELRRLAPHLFEGAASGTDIANAA